MQAICYTDQRFQSVGRKVTAVSRKRDMILVLALLAAALLFLAVSLAARKKTPDAPTPSPSETAEVTEPSESDAYRDFISEYVKAYFEEYPAESYLFVSIGGDARSPIPLNGDNSFRIAQEDGSENVIHIGKDSFYMESSNCENQTCVEQGEVTVENRDTRPLFNMVICLPHNLMLELLTREEAEVRLTELYAGEKQVPASEN